MVVPLGGVDALQLTSADQFVPSKSTVRSGVTGLGAAPASAGLAKVRVMVSVDSAYQVVAALLAVISQVPVPVVEIKPLGSMLQPAEPPQCSWSSQFTHSSHRLLRRLLRRLFHQDAVHRHRRSSSTVSHLGRWSRGLIL